MDDQTLTPKAIKEELDSAPSLKTFEYQAWDESTRNFVNSVIKMYLNPGQAMDSVTSSFEDNTQVEASTPPKKATPAKKAVPAAEATGGSDDLESFLNDLEI